MRLNPHIISDRIENRRRILTVHASSQTARGLVRVQVIDRNGNVIEDRPEQKNLILNQGLNGVCSTYTWADAFLYCAAGSGTTATNTTSGAGVTAAGAGTTFTNDTPGSFDWTTNAAIGDMIQMTSGTSSGTEVRITAITDANNVEYTPSGTINSGEFTVFHTAQTGLTTELKRTNNYLTGAGNCGASFASSTLTLKRTYDFTAEVGSVTYNEVGFSNVATVAANLFSRIKLASGVSLTAGQSLRIIYSLQITLSPTTSTGPVTFNITGWPVSPATDTNGTYSVIRPGLSGVTTSGNSTWNPGGSLFNGWDNSPVAGNGGICHEPSVSVSASTGTNIWISPSSAAIDAFASTGSPTSRSTNATNQAVTLTTYTALDFFRDKTVTFAIGTANRTDFRSMGLGQRNDSSSVVASAGGQGFVCLFGQAQTKDSLHTLTLNFRITVGRTLA